MMGEKARRFNILDVALILFVLLVAIGVWQRPNLQKLFTSEELLDRYAVTFEMKKVRSTTVELLQKGTGLYMMNGEEQISLGELAQPLAATAATVYLQDRNGQTVKAVYPQDANEYLLDATGMLLCEGVEHSGSFLVGGKMYLAVNQVVLDRKSVV